MYVPLIKISIDNLDSGLSGSVFKIKLEISSFDLTT